MRTTNMTERITFVTKTTEIDENFEPVETTEERFSCWAEVSRMTVRDFVNYQESIGTRRSSPVFLIAYKQKEEVATDWLIKWRGKTYEITGLDPDYQKKDLTKIQAREVS